MLRSALTLSALLSLLTMTACTETAPARGRGGGGGGSPAFDSGSDSGTAAGDIEDGGDAAADEDATLADADADTADTAPEPDSSGTDTSVTDANDTGPDDTTPDDTGVADSTPADTAPEDTTPADTAPVDTTPADTDIADTSVADTDPGTYRCGSAPVFTGQVGGLEIPGGGFAIPLANRASFTYPAANLSSVALQFPVVDGTPTPLASPIPVVGAVVVATSYLTAAAVPPAQSNFWVADRFGTIEVRLDYTNAANVPPFPVRVGQRLSFSVTALSSYQGVGQIQAATDWSVVSEGSVVHILERSATPLSLTELTELVRVEGTITGGGAACGGTSRCFDLSYGSGNLVTLRTASTFAAIGQCITFVGPLSQFGGALQLNATNFDWTTTVF